VSAVARCCFEEKGNPQRGIAGIKNRWWCRIEQTRRTPPETVKVERGGPNQYGPIDQALNL
jgi:hypothetical protein